MSEILNRLQEKMILSIKNSLKTTQVGVAFSGGVDSSLLVTMCAKMGLKVTLLTIGFNGSHDLDFSKKISSMMGLKHYVYVIPEKSFSQVALKIRNKITTDNLSWNENCIAFYYVSKLAKAHKIKQVLTSNGIDELFCGYNAYRDVLEYGDDSVMQFMESKLDNEIKMMKVVNSISSESDVQILQPFLSDDFIEFSKTVPISYKIKGKNDLIRKHIVRQLALSLGVPEESALKRKKALQYGSLIHKNLVKVMKTWNSSS